MPQPVADRNLLFGILALQMDFIAKDQLLAAMQTWVFDKTKSLGDILCAQKALDAESLKKYAQEIGLDVAKWETDKESPEVAKQVDEESKLAATVQVTGTPSLFINGKKVSNRTFDGLKGMIDEALKKG